MSGARGRAGAAPEKRALLQEFLDGRLRQPVSQLLLFGRKRLETIGRKLDEGGGVDAVRQRTLSQTGRRKSENEPDFPHD